MKDSQTLLSIIFQCLIPVLIAEFRVNWVETQTSPEKVVVKPLNLTKGIGILSKSKMLWIIHLILRFYLSGQPPSGPSKQLHPAKPNQAFGLQTGVVSGSRVGSRRALCSIARIQIGNRHEKTAATEYPLDWRWTPGLGPGRLGKRFGISSNTHITCTIFLGFDVRKHERQSPIRWKDRMFWNGQRMGMSNVGLNFNPFAGFGCLEVNEWSFLTMNKEFELACVSLFQNIHLHK